MKKTAILSIVFLMLMAMVQSAFAQKTMDTAKYQKFLSKLKVGEWVELEGIVQPDFSVLLQEIEVVYGEVEEDDWEINGKISRVDPEKKNAFMLMLPIHFDNNVEYEDKLNVIKSFSDIKQGMMVEIEGSYLQDGTFLANEIGQIEVKKDSERNEIEWTGKIQEIDIQNLTITVLGHNMIFNTETKLKTVMFD